MPGRDIEADKRERDKKRYINNKSKEGWIESVNAWNRTHHLQIDPKYLKIVKMTGDKEGPWACNSCSESFKYPWLVDLDHITPVKDGGTNCLSNFQILCPNCHRVKTHQEQCELIKKRGFESKKSRYLIVETIGSFIQNI